MSAVSLFAVMVVVAPAVTFLIVWWLYNHTLLKPSQYPEGDWQPWIEEGIKAEEVFFTTAGGKKLQGFFFHNPNADLVVLCSHGNAHNETIWRSLHALTAVVKAGQSALVFDYREFGKSEGTASIAGLVEDGKGAYNYLQDKGFQSQQIVLMGYSMGTGVSCEIADYGSCAGVILLAGFASLQKIMHEVAWFTRLVPGFLLFRPAMNNAKILSKLHVPVLIIHGEKDKLFHVGHSMELYASANEPKTLVLLPSARHGMQPDRQDLLTETSAIARFLANLVSLRRQAGVLD